MRLQYQQVQGPNLSASLAGLGQAQRSIAQGIAGFGSSITGLGDRLEARRNKKLALQQSAALEAFKFDQYNEQAQASGQAPVAAPGVVGAADFLFKQNTQNLADDATRASTADTRQITSGRVETQRGTRILNDGAAIELGQSQARDNFQREHAPDILAANNLGAQGRRDEAQAVLDRIISTAGPKYGSDAVIQSIADLQTRLRDGDDTRNQISKNSKARDLDDAKLRDQKVITQGRGIQNDQRAFDLSESQDAARDADIVQGTIANVLSNSASPEDALLAIRNSNLTETQKVQAASGVQSVLDSNPAALDTFNPIDPETNAVLSLQNGGPSNTDFSASSDFVRGAIDGANRRSPTVQIRQDAESFAPDGQNINLDEAVKSAFPNRAVSDKQLNRIESIQRNLGISDGEVMAILDRSIGRRGFGITNILPGGKKASDRVVNVDDFKKAAETYVEDISQGNAEVTAGERQRAIQQTQQLEKEFSEASRARARALQAGDRTAVAKYDRIIQQLELRSASIENGAANLERTDRQRAQGRVERFRDPFRSDDALTDALLGITDEQRELRTTRQLR